MPRATPLGFKTGPVTAPPAFDLLALGLPGHTSTLARGTTAALPKPCLPWLPPFPES